MVVYTSAEYGEINNLITILTVEVLEGEEAEKKFDNVHMLIVFHDTWRGGIWDGGGILRYFQNDINYCDYDELMEGYISYDGNLTKKELLELFSEIGFDTYN